MAAELGLKESDLAAKAYEMHGRKGLHIELMFKGARSIELGRQLEKSILNGKKSFEIQMEKPLPNLRPKRLYLEEIFNCGPLATGIKATKPPGGWKWTLPDSGWQPPYKFPATGSGSGECKDIAKNGAGRVRDGRTAQCTFYKKKGLCSKHGEQCKKSCGLCG